MKSLAISTLALLLLSGCAVGEYAVNQLPTAKYCDAVDYIRRGDDVTMALHCTAPFGGM